MAVAEALPPAGSRSNALKLAALGAVSGAVSWLLITYADPLNIHFDIEEGVLVLLPVGVFPGLVFGILFAAGLVLARRANGLRGLGYTISSAVGYLAAFHVAFYILGNLSHGSDTSFIVYVGAGIAAGLVGSAVLGLATKILFSHRGYRLFTRSVIVGSLAGALLVLGMFDDHNGLGFLAFFILWQAAYGACLAPLLGRPAQR